MKQCALLPKYPKIYEIKQSNDINLKKLGNINHQNGHLNRMKIEKKN